MSTPRRSTRHFGLAQLGALAALALPGCRATPTTARVIVSAAPEVGEVHQLAIKATAGGRELLRSLPAMPARQSLPISFTVTVAAGGPFKVVVDGLGADGKVAGSGEAMIDLALGVIADVAVQLRRVAVPPDGGVDSGGDGPAVDLAGADLAAPPADLLAPPPDLVVTPLVDMGSADQPAADLLLVCKPGFANCDNDPQDGCETSTSDDAKNCGGCGKVCSNKNLPGPACAGGKCAGACAAGYADCNGDKLADGCETNLLNDTSHCGACGNKCVNMLCNSGVCGGAMCQAGLADCNADPKDMCEVNTNTDALNCGACKAACSTQNVPQVRCSAGLCNGACAVGYADCDNDKRSNGCEVNLATANENCGGCGIQCGAIANGSAACQAGKCAITKCNPSFADCDKSPQNGCEVLTASDVKSCGGCAMACPAIANGVPTCVNGSCGQTCNPGFRDCDGKPGCEVSTDSDPDHCGGCGRPCSARNVNSRSCTGGVCTSPCAAGFGDCNSDKLGDGCEINIFTDVAHCGGCGKACNLVCNSGVCGGIMCMAPKADCDLDKMVCEVDLSSDASHCGACKQACSSNNIVAQCSASACVGACKAGYADCNANKLSDGCEINTLTDLDHCGGCGRKCSSTNVSARSCTIGLCTGACAANFGDCNANKLSDGCEIDLLVTPDHCSGCGRACSNNNMATRTCKSGVCNGACAAGFADCNANKLSDGCEINLNTDPVNCGGCGANFKCSTTNVPNPACSAGRCSGACAVGYADCNGDKLVDGCEIATGTDEKNCGKCGLACPASSTCISGLCSKRVFVTSATYNGALGGLAGADSKCQGLANGVGLVGPFKAWLSDSATSADQRLTHHPGAYTLLDGRIVAKSWTELASASHGNPINLTERKGAPPNGTVTCITGPAAWTGTATDGSSLAMSNCTNYTSTFMGSGAWGDPTKTDYQWTKACSGGSCGWFASLYCIEQ